MKSQINLQDNRKKRKCLTKDASVFWKFFRKVEQTNSSRIVSEKLEFNLSGATKLIESKLPKTNDFSQKLENTMQTKKFPLDGLRQLIYEIIEEDMTLNLKIFLKGDPSETYR